MPHPEKNHRSVVSVKPRSDYYVGMVGTEIGKVIEVFHDRLVIKSPTLNVESRVVLTTEEFEALADLIMGDVQRERGQADHDDEVVL